MMSSCLLAGMHFRALDSMALNNETIMSIIIISIMSSLLHSPPGDQHLNGDDTKAENLYFADI